MHLRRRGHSWIGAACLAAALGTVPASTIGLAAQDPGRATFDSIGAQSLANGRAPGFSMAVVLHGRIVYARGFGIADLARRTPVATGTRFAIGSLSKQFVAAAILRLVERGSLSLDDHLAGYLPRMPKAQRITVRELLNQTSGLHNFPRTDEHHWPLQGVIAPASLFSILRTDTADFAPGTRWAYSNTNYAALADIVAQEAGRPYATWLRREIFAPLHMDASGAGYAVQAGTATPYQGTGVFTKQFTLSLDLFYGAGDIVSSATDLARWDIALLQGRVLDAASMHDLWTAGQLADGTPVNYAMGFVPASLAGHREVWHNGLAPGAGGYCYNAIFPDDGLAVIVLSNGLNFAGEPERMVRSVLEAYFPDARQTSSARAAEASVSRAQAQ